ncbi:MAG: AAA family ATPase [Vibrio splendidus]
MKILKVSIANFLALGSAEISLDEKGLVLLQGDNRDDSSQDSNGAGKSSLPDAISWCLYGATAREEGGDDVINNKVGKNCAVVTTIEDDGSIYRVSRHRKHKTHKNRLRLELLEDDKWKDLTLGTDKLTQVPVTQLIGCSKDVFCAAIYAGQENLVDLPAMTDKFLKTVVEEAAGIDRLQRGYAIASKNVTIEKGKVNETSAKIDGVNSRISLQEANAVNLTEKADQWELGHKASLKELTEQVREFKAKYTAASAEDIEGQITKSLAQIAKVDKALDAANTKNNDLIILEGKIENLTSVVTKEQRIYTSSELKSNALKATWEKAKKAKAVDCEACGQAVTSEEARKAHVDSHHEAYKDQMVIVKSHDESLEELRGELRELKSEHDKKLSSKVDTSKLKDISQKLTDRHNALKAKQSNIEKLKTRLSERAKQLKDKKAATNPHFATIEETKEQIKADKEKLSEAKTELEGVEYQLQVAEATAKVFGPAGVRAHLLDAVTPFLNDRTSHYLSTLSDGNISAIWTTLGKDSKGELKEKFSISVESSTGGKSFKSLSGGEKRKVRLSTYLALQDLVASRASKPIGLLVADEIDQAIDKSGLERLMSILDEKAKERGTAIVISHTDLKSWISDSVTIVKEGGVSRIEGHALS